MAVAETVNITEGAGSVVMSEFANITGSGLTASDYNSGWSSNSCVAFTVDKASYSEFEQGSVSPTTTLGTEWTFDVGIRGDLAGYQTNANNALVLTYSFGNAAIRSNERFRVVTPSKYMTVTGASDATSTLTLYHVFIGNSQSNMHEVTLSSGYYVADLNVTYIALVFSASNRSSSLLRSDHTNWIHSIPQVITFMEDESIRQQTETLMSTSGSDSVVSGVQGQAVQFVDSLGFVSQSASFVQQVGTSFADAQPSEGLQFPGLSLMGFTIPAQQVNFLGWLGADLENQIKTGITIVIFLAWLNGLRGIYHKIFLGETEVEVVDE